MVSMEASVPSTSASPRSTCAGASSAESPVRQRDGDKPTAGGLEARRGGRTAAANLKRERSTAAALRNGRVPVARPAPHHGQQAAPREQTAGRQHGGAAQRRQSGAAERRAGARHGGGRAGGTASWQQHGGRSGVTAEQGQGTSADTARHGTTAARGTASTGEAAQRRRHAARAGGVEGRPRSGGAKGRQHRRAAARRRRRTTPRWRDDGVLRRAGPRPAADARRQRRLAAARLAQRWGTPGGAGSSGGRGTGKPSKARQRRHGSGTATGRRGCEPRNRNRGDPGSATAAPPRLQRPENGHPRLHRGSASAARRWRGAGGPGVAGALRRLRPGPRRRPGPDRHAVRAAPRRAGGAVHRQRLGGAVHAVSVDHRPSHRRALHGWCAQKHCSGRAPPYQERGARVRGRRSTSRAGAGARAARTPRRRSSSTSGSGTAGKPARSACAALPGAAGRGPCPRARRSVTAAAEGARRSAAAGRPSALRDVALPVPHERAALVERPVQGPAARPVRAGLRDERPRPPARRAGIR